LKEAAETPTTTTPAPNATLEMARNTGVQADSKIIIKAAEQAWAYVLCITMHDADSFQNCTFVVTMIFIQQ
jgi:hypothetical protein